MQFDSDPCPLWFLVHQQKVTRDDQKVFKVEVMLERRGESISLLTQEELNRIFQDIEQSWDEINRDQGHSSAAKEVKEIYSEGAKNEAKVKPKFWKQLKRKIGKVAQKIFNPKKGEYHKRMQAIKSQWVR